MLLWALGSDIVQVSELHRLFTSDDFGEKSPPAEAAKTGIQGHSQGKPAVLLRKFLSLTQTLNTECFLSNFLLPVPSVPSCSSTVPDSW